jgi:hypothetical protein
MRHPGAIAAPSSSIDVRQGFANPLPEDRLIVAPGKRAISMAAAFGHVERRSLSLSRGAKEKLGVTDARRRQAQLRVQLGDARLFW